MKDNPNLVTEEELLAWTHFKTRAPLIRWLDQQGIESHRGAGGRVCTTLQALNSRGSANDDGLEFA